MYANRLRDIKICMDMELNDQIYCSKRSNCELNLDNIYAWIFVKEKKMTEMYERPTCERLLLDRCFFEISGKRLKNETD